MATRSSVLAWRIPRHVLSGGADLDLSPSFVSFALQTPVHVCVGRGDSGPAGGQWHRGQPRQWFSSKWENPPETRAPTATYASEIFQVHT